MKAYRKCVAFALVLSAPGVASAQAAENATEAAAPAPGSWQSYPNERHLVGRLLGGVGLRLNDSYGAGVLAPPFVLGEVSFLFLNVGDLHLGASVGGQVGFDLHSGTQGAVQPGIIGLYRASSRIAVTGRIDVPILFTNGTNTPFFLPAPGTMPMVSVPQNTNTAVGLGIELGVGGAYYLTSGIAITAEISGDVYFGNAGFVFPVLGVGAGILVDYEILP